MEIKKVALNRIFENIKKELFLERIERLGFKYMKSRKCFESKKGDLIMEISIHLEYQNEYQIDEDGNFYLNFNVTSSIDTKGFSEWYKKNYNEHWSFGKKLNNISTSFLVENPDFEKEDFYNPSESNSFKKLISKGFRNDDIQKKESIKTFIEKIENKLVPDILENCNWEYLLKKISEENKESSWQDIRLLIYLGHNNAKDKFLELLNEIKENYKNVEEWEKEDFANYIEEREKEYNQLFK